MRLNSHMSILQGECHHVKPGKTRVLDVITCELVVNISTAESCTIFKTFFLQKPSFENVDDPD